MTTQELDELLDMLADYYDVSDEILPPIMPGSDLHHAIAAWRETLPGQHLPPDVAGLWRELLHASRSKKRDERRKAAAYAEQLAELLEEKYASEPLQREQLTDAQRYVLDAMGDEVMRAEQIADRTNYSYDRIRHILPTMVQLGLIVRTPKGYRKTRMC